MSRGFVTRAYDAYRGESPWRSVGAPTLADLKGWAEWWRSTIGFMRARRLYLPRYLMMAVRFAWLKISKPWIETDGFVFIEKGVEIHARRGYGRLRLGKWVYLGTGNAIRCHEGNLRIGDRCVFGRKNTINTYLDIEIHSDCIFADWIYICDFDHRYDDLTIPIMKQGIVKSPVRIGSGCWFGEKTTVLRGVTVGDGAVIASHALVNRDIPDGAIVGGVPAKVLRYRKDGQRGTS